MAELVGSVVKYLTVKETNIDNFVFKLFYKFTFILLFASSVLLHLTQFFGDPIDCSFANNNDFKEDYCWIHGSPVFSYEDVHEKKIGCNILPPNYYINITKEGRFPNDEDVPTTSYYQWVSLVLLVQAGSFVLPYKLWKMLEGGLMKSFGTEGKLKIMLGEYYSIYPLAPLWMSIPLENIIYGERMDLGINGMMGQQLHLSD